MDSNPEQLNKVSKCMPRVESLMTRGGAHGQVCVAKKQMLTLPVASDSFPLISAA